jgi:hypothetical protein
MRKDEAIFDVVMNACMRQAQHPDENGGGIIGRAAAVVNALRLDGDLPLASIRQTGLRQGGNNVSAKAREYEAWCGTCGNHWYLRLRGITDPAPLVHCPRCRCNGVANELPPVSR